MRAGSLPTRKLSNACISLFQESRGRSRVVPSERNRRMMEGMKSGNDNKSADRLSLEPRPPLCPQPARNSAFSEVLGFSSGSHQHM